MTGEEQAWQKADFKACTLKKECLRILDVGTGPGFFAINLALAGHEGHGSRCDGAYDLACKARMQRAMVQRWTFLVQRGEFLPFEAWTALT